jgi:hypothetical protein
MPHIDISLQISQAIYAIRRHYLLIFDTPFSSFQPPLPIAISAIFSFTLS